MKEVKLSQKIEKLVGSKKFTLAISFFGLYLLVTGISLAVFSYLNRDANVFNGDIADVRSKIESLPKTEECPLNGKLYSTVERDIWEKRRPITAIIENHADARPISGLSKADIVYEAVAEGGITRFLGIFYCGASAEDVQIAPVRSARVYFIDWASEYGKYPIFMHVGGANNFGGTGETIVEAQALELLETIGWRVAKGNDFDTTYDSGFPVFWRNYERLEKTVATEHTMMSSLDAAYKEAEKRGFDEKDGTRLWSKDYDSWEFADGRASSSPDVSKISFGYWSGKNDYDVAWEYDSAANSYLRSNDGKAFIDHETGEQVSTSNVVVQFVRERGPVDANLHMLYTTTGSGKTLIFQNGEVIEGTWEKDARAERTVFYDASGDEIDFVRGSIWIHAVPAGNSVEY